MDRNEIIERLERIAKHAVHTAGEKPFVMSLDDGIAVHEAIEILKQPEQGWILCDETIEIPGHEVLVCDKYGEEILGYLEYADEQWICESEDCVMYDPIAWMEKPQPARKKEKRWRSTKLNVL